MPYATNQSFTRAHKRLHQSMTGGSAYSPGDWLVRPVYTINTVFSHRHNTNKLVDGSVSTPATYDQALQALNGGQPPSNLAEKLVARRKFIENSINDAVEPANGGITHFSTADKGHPFAVHRVQSEVLYTKVTYSDQYGGKYDADCVLNVPSRLGVPGSITNQFYETRPTEAFSTFGWSAYPGVTLLTNSNPSYKPFPKSLEINVGTRLIGELNPYASTASFLATLIELMRGDVPTVIRNLRKYITDINSLKKTIGSDYLNIQFGWAPLLKDIEKLVNTCITLDTLLFTSDNKRRSTRRTLVDHAWNGTTDSFDRRTVAAPFATFLSTTKEGTPGLPPAALTLTYQEGLVYSRQNVSINYTARYTKGVRSNAILNGRVDQAITFLGMDLTPDVLWQVTPWSWLLDWFANLGDVISNITNLSMKDIILDYAYLTNRIETERGILAWKPSLVGNMTSSRYTVGHKVITVEKTRNQASPYGFSVGFDGLSPYQISILVALGLARGR